PRAGSLVMFGSKMLVPTGVGVVWARSQRLEQIESVERGGDMIADVTLHGATWAQIPHRFEAGTPPIMEVIGLGAAIDYLDKIGLSSIAAHDRALTEYALDALASVPALEIEGPSDPRSEEHTSELQSRE